jgi:GT2 family glycosyltransferase
MDVSFVIVSWNAKEYLRGCLRSIAATCRDTSHEIIVVDNASHDGSPEMLEAEFPEVRVVRNADNLGFAGANNQGTALARGRYLALVNSDVELLPDALRRLVAFLDEHPDVGIAGPKVLNGDGTLQASCRTEPSLRSWLFRSLALDTRFPRSRLFGDHYMTHWSHDEVRDVEVLSGCFWMIRRSAHEQVGGLDARFFMYAEDMDLCRRYREAGWRVTFFPGARIVHFGGGSSGNAPARFWVELLRANLQYWKKHHTTPAAAALYAIFLLHHAARVPGFALRRLLQPAARGARGEDKLALNVRTLGWLLRPSTFRLVLAPADPAPARPARARLAERSAPRAAEHP